MLFKLLFAPFTAPFSGFRFVMNQAIELAERELYDVDSLREELLLLNMQLEGGEMTQQEFQEREAEVIARLHAARERQKQLGA